MDYLEATVAHITVGTGSNDITALGGTDTALATAGTVSNIPGGFFCRFQFCNVLIEEETVER